MGACICPSGKGVDVTGHCVYMPCPKGDRGGIVFRNDEGKCMECGGDTDCKAGFVCNAHACQPKPECSTAADCGPWTASTA